MPGHNIFHSLAIFLVVTVMLGGCSSQLRNKQLESVAKDWSYVVRASQVIPVYPLTEDLQPGDVLLVSIPIDEQQKLYAEKGYLPLDQLMIRLNPSGYREFYSDRYGTAEGEIPAIWQKEAAFGNHSAHQWRLAPSAGFPAYDFEVGTGVGMSLAIPVQGVPIALGLMKSGKAKGSIVIGRSYTYGLDNVTLEKLVTDWAKEKRALLGMYRPVDVDGKKKRHFLRVVSRVYVVGDVNVTINNEDSGSADLGAGADKTVSLPALKDKDAAQNYKESLTVFNNLLKEQLPGGKVKIAAASSRSVTMTEQFERPLVIGYIGFDLPILQGGRLGAPISTLSQLTDTPILSPSDGNVNLYRLAALSHMHRALREIQGPTADAVRANLDGLRTLLPDTYPFALYELASAGELRKDTNVVTGAKVEKRDFRDVLDYIGKCEKTIDTLDKYMALQKTGEEKRSELAADLRAARTAMEKLGLEVSKQQAIAEAISFVFLGY